MGADATSLSKLHWRCRRGMQEMDIMLLRYLDRGWPVASPDQRLAFERLLETEDDQLWDWLIGRGQPDDAGLADVVHAIRQLPAR